MMKVLGILSPFLLAAIPVVHIVAENPGASGFSDLLLILGALAAACALVYALAALAVRGRDPWLPAQVACLGVAWFYGYPAVVRRVFGGPDAAPHWLVVSLGLLASAGLIWSLRRRPDWIRQGTAFLGLTAALLTAWSSIGIGTAWVREQRTVEQSELLADLSRPIEGPTTSAGPRRNIYLIILDEYANSQELRANFGFANRRFTDSLRTLGFYVPSLVRSNYAHTILSVPSILNASQVSAIERDLKPGSPGHGLVNHLVDQSRVARYLKARGYRYLFFPSQWWFATRTSSVADVRFEPWEGLDLRRELSRTELRRTVRGVSVLSYLDQDHRWDAEHIRRSLEGIAAVSDAEGPVFAVVHLIAPHSPYVFEQDCGVRERAGEEGGEETELYRSQVECVNRMLLGVVNHLLRTSKTPPIILLQGDHGTKLLGAPEYAAVDEIPAAAARERLGAFGAYYLPDGGRAAFGDTVTAANVLGNVLRYYFGARLPPAGDELYLSTGDDPFTLKRVDEQWLAGKHTHVGERVEEVGQAVPARRTSARPE